VAGIVRVREMDMDPSFSAGIGAGTNERDKEKERDRDRWKKRRLPERVASDGELVSTYWQILCQLLTSFCGSTTNRTWIC